MSSFKLAVEGLGKDYPGTVALDEVSVRFAPGEVHALIGKNGAGKSTLVKILAGSVTPSRGRILYDGVPVALRSPQDAFDYGIAMVYQELSLVPGLTVAENILLGRTPKRRGLIDWAATYTRAENVLARLGVAIDVRVRTGDLGVAQQQIVEIAKAMSFDPAVLILDEPTSALATHETEQLFRVVKGLAAAGVAIIYISHRLQELHSIADRVTVLRDGHHIGTVAMRETSIAEIVQMMFGEVAQQERPDDLQPGATPVLEVQGLSRGRLYRCELRALRGRNPRHCRDAGRGPHRTAARPLRRRRLRPRADLDSRPARSNTNPSQNEGAGLGLYP